VLIIKEKTQTAQEAEKTRVITYPTLLDSILSASASQRLKRLFLKKIRTTQ